MDFLHSGQSQVWPLLMLLSACASSKTKLEGLRSRASVLDIQNRVECCRREGESGILLLRSRRSWCCCSVDRFPRLSAMSKELKKCHQQTIQVRRSDQFRELVAEWESIWDACVNDGICERNVTISSKTISGMDKYQAFEATREKMDRVCFSWNSVRCGGGDNDQLRGFYTPHNNASFLFNGYGPFCYPFACADLGNEGILQHFQTVDSSQSQPMEFDRVAPSIRCHDNTFLQLQPNLPDAEPDTTPIREHKDTESMSTQTLMLIAGAVALVLFIAGVVFCRRRRRKAVQDIEANAYKEETFSKSDKGKYGSSRSGGSSHQRNTSMPSEGSMYQLIETSIDPSQIRLFEIVGQGSFGAVHRGDYLGSMVAVKVLFRKSSEFDEFASEIELLQSLRHPNIVQFIGTSYIEDYGVCALTEFLHNGDLTTVLRSFHQQEAQEDLERQISWDVTTTVSKLKIALDIVKGLAYLHGIETPIVHRDLKSRNILLSESYVAKIADFGVSRAISRTETMTAAGSTLWQAPEVLRGERFDEKADIYSFGVILSELDTEEIPYFDRYVVGMSGERIKMNVNAIAFRVLSSEFLPTLSTECPEQIRLIALQCLERNPGDRPDAMDLLEELKKFAEGEQEARCLGM